MDEKNAELEGNRQDRLIRSPIFAIHSRREDSGRTSNRDDRENDTLRRAFCGERRKACFDAAGETKTVELAAPEPVRCAIE